MLKNVIFLENLKPEFHGFNWGPVAVFVAGSMWACDGIFRPYVSTRLNAEALVAWEHIISLVPLSPLILHYIVKERKSLGSRQWVCLIALGIGADALANTFITIGYSLGHLALVALLQQSQPVFGFIGACIFLHEDLHGRVAFPLAAGAFLGLFLMLWPYARAVGLEAGAWTGIKAGAYGLGAAVIWASETVACRWLLQHSTPTLSALELLTYRQTIGLVSLVLYVYVLAAKPACDVLPVECLTGVQPTPRQALVIAVIATIELSSHLLYYVGLTHTPATVAVVMELSHPLLILTVIPKLTVLFDPSYVRSPLEPEQVTGALILIASTVILGLYAARLDPKDGRHAASAHSSDTGSPPPVEPVEMRWPTPEKPSQQTSTLEPKGECRRATDGKPPRKAPFPAIAAGKFTD